MKKFYITLIMAISVLSLTAQNHQVQNRGFMGANPANLEPKFTQEQRESIKALRFELEKEMVQVQNQLGEKKAQLKTLQQVDKPDMKAINSKIDEITSLQNKMMKAKAANTAKIRSLLTDEQRLMFDKRGAHAKRPMIGRRGTPQGVAMQRGAMQRGLRPGAMNFQWKEGEPGKEVKIMRIERKAEAPVNN
ncbi:MAG: hypothetical protein CVU10_04170 [Bacteroidetes bacterium HGW-Bacteroidetes-5]|jgi:Spy/CpxP family protein refolding chaperone|nr:MAG: hypothetical protein CVU10_04170 [Bacteroidetes bacterium HGW-Bacteroidetes-5]